MGRTAIIPAALTVFVLCWCSVRAASGEIVCADDLAPEGMAVTTTGTSPNCAGSCRAREMEPVCGPVMKICAGQPIPDGYLLDSITTTPACACVGTEDNAYVIRYVGTRDGHFVTDQTDPYLSEEPDPSITDRYRNAENSSAEFGIEEPTNRPERPVNPYGDPPFGNVLCAETQWQRQPYGNAPSSSSQTRDSFPSNPFQLRDNGTGAAPLSNPVAQPPSWNSFEEENEPFRVGP
jgi:hypothetical protein